MAKEEVLLASVVARTVAHTKVSMAMAWALAKARTKISQQSFLPMASSPWAMEATGMMTALATEVAEACMAVVATTAMVTTMTSMDSSNMEEVATPPPTEEATITTKTVAKTTGRLTNVKEEVASEEATMVTEITTAINTKMVVATGTTTVTGVVATGTITGRCPALLMTQTTMPLTSNLMREPCAQEGKSSFHTLSFSLIFDFNLFHILILTFIFILCRSANAEPGR